MVQEYNLPPKKQSGEYVSSYFSRYCEKARTRKEWIGNGKEIDFSGVKCTIPENYDSYLKALYGDYMKLPPEEKRVSQHDIIFCSLDEDYKK